MASPIVPYKLHIVPLVAFLDAVDTDGVPVGRVAGVTPGEGSVGDDSTHQHSEDKHNTDASVWQVNGGVRAPRSPVEVVHGVAGVAGDLVETLASAHRLLDGVLVALDLIVWRQREGRSVHSHPQSHDDAWTIFHLLKKSYCHNAFPKARCINLDMIQCP